MFGILAWCLEWCVEWCDVFSEILGCRLFFLPVCCIAQSELSFFLKKIKSTTLLYDVFFKVQPKPQLNTGRGKCISIHSVLSHTKLHT
jgi:hypothetical protein